MQRPSIHSPWIHVHLDPVWRSVRDDLRTIPLLHRTSPSSTMAYSQCEASGALLCYILSAILAPPLLALPFYRARVETWRIKIMGDPKKGKEVSWDGVLAFLIVLRIAPFPPHWVANFVAPHLGISMLLFFSSVFIGKSLTSVKADV